MADEIRNCCSPSAAGQKTRSSAADCFGGGRGADLHSIEQAMIPAGEFTMGDHQGDGKLIDGERPLHAVSVDEFKIDVVTVTNEQFAAFIDDTHYLTDAEKFGFSAVFHLFVAAEPDDIVGRFPGTPWWTAVKGATWRSPEGRRSDIAGRKDHPVVHISWNDAEAYCRWADRRLPTEAEWEYASRGGLDGYRFPWGNELSPDHWQCNIWQGEFPDQNTGDDGWLATAPARSFQPNGYGLWQTIGNVWEWCSDWHDLRAYGEHSGSNPKGPTRGHAKVIRGGSYLCHNSYCNRYRNAARSYNSPDSSTANTGFRTIAATPGAAGKRQQPL